MCTYGTRGRNITVGRVYYKEQGMVNEAERKPMIGAIRECDNRQILETMFDRFEVKNSDKGARINALKEAMGNPDVFFSSGDMDMDRQYESLVGAFLSGIWKDNAI
jgi:hypothetical protein